jgi:hypothetical protein
MFVIIVSPCSTRLVEKHTYTYGPFATLKEAQEYADEKLVSHYFIKEMLKPN